jgi:hypothetical protein
MRYPATHPVKHDTALLLAKRIILRYETGYATHRIFTAESQESRQGRLTVAQPFMAGRKSEFSGKSRRDD